MKDSTTAIIKDRGRTYTVSEGASIKVDYLEGKPGTKVAIKDILLLQKGEHVQIGKPTLKSGSVDCEIVKHVRDEKIVVFKIKRRKSYRRRNGHRQDRTILRVNSING